MLVSGPIRPEGETEGSDHDRHHRTAIRDAKMLIFAAAHRVRSDTPLVAGRLGILVDEELGTDVARAAEEAGFVLAIPRDTQLPAWMAQSLLAEVDALRESS